MNFQTIWIPLGFLAKFCQKKAGLEKHSYLKYALEGKRCKKTLKATFFLRSRKGTILFMNTFDI